MSLIRHCSLRTFIREAKEILSLSDTSSSLSLSSSPSISWNDPFRVRLREQGRLVLVIGNEGADLDSLSSALVYAYVNTQEASRKGKQERRESGDSTLPRVYIPLINTRRADLRLRPEFLPVLSRAGIVTVEELITVDDILSSKLDMETSMGKKASEKEGVLAAELKKAEVVLVDENILRGELASRFGEQVAGVIDHHEVEREKERYVNKMNPWLVKQVGSCTSLAVQSCRKHWDQLRKDEGERWRWDTELAYLALASVLVDTRCLKDESKTTEEDRKAVEYLEDKVRKRDGLVDDRYDRSAYFSEISTAKEDIGKLQIDEILRKDYKQWNETLEHKQAKTEIRLGISSVVKSMRFLSEKAMTEIRTDSEEYQESNSISFKLVLKMARFATERKLDFYATMTAFRSDSDEFQRELLLMAISHHAEVQKTDLLNAAQRFEKECNEELGLIDWLNEDGNNIGGQWQHMEDVGLGSFWWNIWRQTNVNKSRKQVAPMLKRMSHVCR